MRVSSVAAFARDVPSNPPNTSAESALRAVTFTQRARAAMCKVPLAYTILRAWYRGYIIVGHARARAFVFVCARREGSARAGLYESKSFCRGTQLRGSVTRDRRPLLPAYPRGTERFKR